MDRNTLTGLVLMMLLLLGYQWYMAPSEEPDVFLVQLNIIELYAIEHN